MSAGVTRHLVTVVLLGAALPGLARADLPAAIERVKPSVVIVGTYKATDNPRFRLRGTGFVVGNGTLVVSNMHVLPEALDLAQGTQLVVQVRDGPSTFQMRNATPLEKDNQHDLTLLSIAGPPVPALALGNSDQVREGQSLAFMGFPIGSTLGYSSVTHRATVSAITEAVPPPVNARQLTADAIRNLRAGRFDIFQLDATAYPGNSGGPLFDPDTANVVGVLNMVLLKGTRESALSQPSGISYAIPARHVQALLDRHQHQ